MRIMKLLVVAFVVVALLALAAWVVLVPRKQMGAQHALAPALEHAPS